MSSVLCSNSNLFFGSNYYASNDKYVISSCFLFLHKVQYQPKKPVASPVATTDSWGSWGYWLTITSYWGVWETNTTCWCEMRCLNFLFLLPSSSWIFGASASPSNSLSVKLCGRLLFPWALFCWWSLSSSSELLYLLVCFCLFASANTQKCRQTRRHHLHARTNTRSIRCLERCQRN